MGEILTKAELRKTIDVAIATLATAGFNCMIISALQHSPDTFIHVTGAVTLICFNAAPALLLFRGVRT